MSALLVACGGVGALFGVIGLTQANGAVQEIEGLIGVLILAVAAAALYTGASIDQTRTPTPMPPMAYAPPMGYPPPPPPHVG